jgi:uncharacterized protein
MAKKTQPRQSRHAKNRRDDLFVRADQEADRGDFESAFRLFLAGARAGNIKCQVNLGNFYDEGKGLRRNRSEAIYWYKRAYRRGHASAANNIGVMWRNEKKHNRALLWFKKAVSLGDPEANLEIAKHYLNIEHNPKRAIHHLRKVCLSNWVTEAGMEEGHALLRRLETR